MTSVLIFLLVIATLGLLNLNGNYKAACADRNRARAEADKLREEVESLKDDLTDQFKESRKARSFIESMKVQINTHIQQNCWKRGDGSVVHSSEPGKYKVIKRSIGNPSTESQFPSGVVVGKHEEYRTI